MFKSHKTKSFVLLIAAIAVLTILFLKYMNMNNTEYTFSIIKPDATARNLTSEINEYFTNNELIIVAQKEITMTLPQAETFYAEHKNRPFYKSLTEYMSSGPIVVQVLKGKDAIKKNREIMGATNPAEAKDGTIRAKYGESIEHNSVHGSDSPESAKREISQFFIYDEITTK